MTSLILLNDLERDTRCGQSGPTECGVRVENNHVVLGDEVLDNRRVKSEN